MNSLLLALTKYLLGQCEHLTGILGNELQKTRCSLLLRLHKSPQMCGDIVLLIMLLHRLVIQV